MDVAFGGGFTINLNDRMPSPQVELAIKWNSPRMELDEWNLILKK